MKTSSFQRLSVMSVHRARGLRASLALLGVIVIIILLRIFAPGILTSAVQPLLAGGTYLTGVVGVIPNMFSDKMTLAHKNDELASANATLDAQNKVLTARVSDLEKLLGSRTEPEKGIIAGVLARPPVVAYDVLIIDAGTHAGVKEGALVMGPGGVPIGTIDTPNPTSSRVVLFSTPAKETTGWVGEARTAVSFTGTGAGTVRATVAKDAAPAVGDVAYTSGPGAIPFGKVAHVDTNPSSPQATFYVQMYTNLFSLTWVTVAP